MKAKHVRLIPLVVFLGLLIFISISFLFKEESTSHHSAMIGKRVSFFDMPLLIGNMQRFNPSAWEGRVVVINFFASWCPTCATEHETLMRLSKTGKVDIYGVAWRDKRENIINWLRKRGNPYKVVGLDKRGKSTIAFGVIGVPESLVIDKLGVVRYVFRGPLTDAIVDKEILPLVSKLSVEYSR